MIQKEIIPCIIFLLLLSLIIPVHAYVPAAMATSDHEGISSSGWVMVPVSDLNTHIQQGQDILSILTPFFAIVILGFLMAARREGRKEVRHHPAFWIGTGAGLCYLGGAAVSIIQLFRALGLGESSFQILMPLTFALIALSLGLAILRLTRTPDPWPVKVRISFGVIAVLGIIFWSGILIGPVLALLAAIIPDRSPAIPKKP